MNSKMQDIQVLAAKLLSKINSSESQIFELLKTYEPTNVIEDELFRTRDYLINIDYEFQGLDTSQIPENLQVASFLPVNLPLYSLILFGFAPSMVAARVITRPSVFSKIIFEKMAQILDLNTICPNIEISYLSRNEFVNKIVSDSTVIIFTGTYENARNVLSKSPKKSLFIFNGVGVNPILVTQDADLSLAVEKVVEVKMFNSGQDCAGPDLILVHHLLYDDFKKALQASIDEIRVGKLGDSNAHVSQLINPDHLREVSHIFTTHSERIIYGGNINYKSGIVQPTIIELNSLNQKDSVELFAPILYIKQYISEEEVNDFLNTSYYKKHEMYISIFGSIPSTINFGKSIILHNKIILDVERGYKEFGGYGKGASFVSNNADIIPKPILINREIQIYFNKTQNRGAN